MTTPAEPRGKMLDNPFTDEKGRETTLETFGEVLIGLADGTANAETVTTAGTAVAVSDATNVRAGESRGITVGNAPARLTIPLDEPGDYLVEIEGEVLGENSAVTQVSVENDGTEDGDLLATNTMAGSAAYQYFRKSKILELAGGAELDLVVDSDSDSDSVSIRRGRFRATKLRDKLPLVG